MTALWTALCVFAFVLLTEWLHSRRIRVAERLAFGPAGVRGWTKIVPWVRAVALGAFAWGLVTLIVLKTGQDGYSQAKKDEEATRLSARRRE